MSLIQYFEPQPATKEIPPELSNPFDNRADQLAIIAADRLREKLNKASALSDALLPTGCGKMFGVLVVQGQSGKIAYLSSFSGKLNQQWLVSGFVPPVFDIDEQSKFLTEGEARLEKMATSIDRLSNNSFRLEAIQNLSDLREQSEAEILTFKQTNQENKKRRRLKREASDNRRIHLELSSQSQNDKLEFKNLKTAWQEKLEMARNDIEQNYENEINSLKQESKLLSQQLHDRVFESYRLRNSLGEVTTIKSLFDGKTPPGGAGDCAAPKLFQYAFQNQLKPLALAEFWYGGSPVDGVRHHGQFYPPCRGKCEPILPFMLKGLGIESSQFPLASEQLKPSIVFEDDDMIVVDKPAGLLSVPGKKQNHSVLSWLASRFPEASGPLLVHRLDMATSGLLLAAKNAQAHKNLQRQFMSRSVEKRYVAVLSKPICVETKTIDLPLRVDLDDRPRQMVCNTHGKKAVTHVEVVSVNSVSTRVLFYPVTGRTHQLRLHSAHIKGLDAPIVGDELYGERSSRMLLHAEKLCFDHPVTGKRLTIKTEVPF